MTSKNILPLILLNLIPGLLALLHLADLYEVINAPGSYPFGHFINGIGSIYTSQSIYTSYCVIQIAMLVLLIGSSFYYQKFKKAYLILWFINFLLFIYPTVTMQD